MPDLVTESRRGASRDLDARSTQELVELMNAEDAKVAAVVGAASTELAALIDAVVDRLRRDGRLVYVGAGTSGGLAALDAAECQTTFSAPPGQVIALVAGGEASSPLDRQTAEDDSEAGARQLDALGVSAADAVVGVTASGTTPYVLGALAAAARAGALTAAVVSAPETELAGLVEYPINVVVGPELVAGSTRLKAGTAQKMVLNTVSTISMIRLGRTFGDLMVDVAATNAKLRARARRIVQIATGASLEEVDSAIAAADGSAKVAIVTLLAGVDAETARGRLAAADGSVREALGR